MCPTLIYTDCAMLCFCASCCCDWSLDCNCSWYTIWYVRYATQQLQQPAAYDTYAIHLSILCQTSCSMPRRTIFFCSCCCCCSVWPLASRSPTVHTTVCALSCIQSSRKQVLSVACSGWGLLSPARMDRFTKTSKMIHYCDHNNHVVTEGLIKVVIFALVCVAAHQLSQL